MALVSCESLVLLVNLVLLVCLVGLVLLVCGIVSDCVGKVSFASVAPLAVEREPRRETIL